MTALRSYLCSLLTIMPILCCCGCSTERIVGITAKPSSDDPVRVASNPRVKDIRWRRIAVFPVNVTQERSSETIMVAGKLRPVYEYVRSDEGTEMLNRLKPALLQKGYTIVERTRLKSILDDRDLTVAGIVGNPQSISLLGNLTRAEVLLFVDLREMRYRWNRRWKGRSYVSIRLARVALGVRAIDVQSGEVLWSGSLRRTSEGLLHKPFSITNKEVLEGTKANLVPDIGKVIDVAINDLVEQFPAPPERNR